MAWQHVGNLRLEGHQSVTLPFHFGNFADVGAQYVSASPIGTFESGGVGGNVGWVAVSQQKAKVWLPNEVQTLYLVTVTNLEPSGVECDFEGGGFA